MFDKAIITKLILIYKDDTLALEFIKDTLNAFSKYVHLINKQENVAMIDKYSLSREDLLYSIKTLDDHRRMVHNLIISGVKRINLLCRENNLDLFYPGDVNDRVAVGDFAFKIVESTFKNRYQDYTK